MISAADLPVTAMTVTAVFTVTVALGLTIFAVLAPQAEVRARAAQLLVVLFGRRPRRR